jgi:acyl dehydratase
VRFAAMTQVGEKITCTGQVTEKFEVNGERRVRLSLTTANAEGQMKLSGEAVIALTWP